MTSGGAARRLRKILEFDVNVSCCALLFAVMSMSAVAALLIGLTSMSVVAALLIALTSMSAVVDLLFAVTSAVG